MADRLVARHAQRRVLRARRGKAKRLHTWRLRAACDADLFRSAATNVRKEISATHKERINSTMHRQLGSPLALRVTSIAAAALAFALVVWGAVVRINGAGMTCPDWPKCRGAWLPSLDDPVVYEFSHRVGAPLLTLLIAATFVLAFRNRRSLPETMRLAWAALVLVFVQIAVGALTIRYANNPPSVAVHLVVGIATFTTLALLAYSAFVGRAAPDARRPSDDAALARVGWLCALLAFAAIFAGGFMSASHAGLACVRFPLCNGWEPAHNALQLLHMNHRIAAYATAVVTAMFAFLGLQRRSTPREIRTLLWLALALVAAQIALGALTVLSGLAPVLRIVHQANGALLAGLLSLIAYRIPRAATRQATLSAAQTSIVGDYIALTKPNVMSLLLFTTLTAMMIAARGLPSLALIAWTLLGGALASASSGAINMYWDRDIDAQMKRTSRRPIPSGRIAPGHALAFGIALGVAAFVELTLTVNYLAAALSTVGILYYVFIYTMWLKRTTPQNIVVGGAAGSIPPLVGWAAVSHHLDLTAFVLFLIIFVWTPPHFWSLALMKTEEYKRVGVPMLPAVRGEAETKRQIIVYSVILVGITVLMVPLHLMGAIYLVSAIALDALFMAGAVWVAWAGTKHSEGTMYKFSMLYLALLFSAMVIDRFGRGSL